MTNEDRSVLGQIDQLSAEEHDLWRREAAGNVTDAERQRLREIELQLDQCWDLLRQRRARRSAGLDPDDSSVRPVDEVEGYQQ